ncbi:MAG: hypothetical protein ACPL5F_01520 [Moorellaceae bacterium]
MPKVYCCICQQPIELTRQEIPAALFPGLHEICQRCKLNHIYFEKFCPGIKDSEEWTIHNCEQARKKAQGNYARYESGRGIAMGKR